MIQETYTFLPITVNIFKLKKKIDWHINALQFFKYRLNTIVYLPEFKN